MDRTSFSWNNYWWTFSRGGGGDGGGGDNKSADILEKTNILNTFFVPFWTLQCGKKQNNY